MPEIRIDRLEGINQSEPDLVYFEAVVRFADGTVKASILCWRYEQAVDAAKKMIDYWEPWLRKFPGVSCQSQAEREELWAIPPQAVSSTFVEYPIDS